MLPKNRIQIVSAAVLCVLFLVYLGFWIQGNSELLFDPMIQTDDARTSLYPLHKYGKEGALEDDPIANEMLDLISHGTRILYRPLVPLFGLFVSAKIVQAFSFFLLLLAAYFLARSARGGIAPAILLLFLFLHTTFVINRMAGGLPRGFAFPALALWSAGALAQSERQRYMAAILAALFYPTAMMIILAAEGLMSVRDIFLPDGMGRTFDRLKRYAILVLSCFILLFPFVFGIPFLSKDSNRGRIHTMEEARKEEAFSRKGRLYLLPLDDAAKSFGRDLALPFTASGRSVFPALTLAYKKQESTGAVVFLAALILLVFFRLSPTPYAAIAVAAGSAIIYLFSRILAFRLYSPIRYHEYGMVAVTCILAVSTVGNVLADSSDSKAPIARNVLTTFFILVVCLFAGDGVVRRNCMPLDGRVNAPLYAFVRTLPKTARIATHPWDGDDLPLWAARATTGGHETFQPWYKSSFRRQVRRLNDTIAALYATRKEDVLSYCDKYHITHFMLRRERYGPRFKRLATFFEPVGRFARMLVSKLKRQDLVLARLPASVIVFSYGPFYIVDVGKLRQLWNGEKS